VISTVCHEITAKVTHREPTAEGYPVVLTHFFESDLHFRIEKRAVPENGISIANYMFLDEEIAAWLFHRLLCPNAIDALYHIDQVLNKHGWELRRR